MPEVKLKLSELISNLEFDDENVFDKRIISELKKELKKLNSDPVVKVAGIKIVGDDGENINIVFRVEYEK